MQPMQLIMFYYGNNPFQMNSMFSQFTPIRIEGGRGDCISLDLLKHIWTARGQQITGEENYKPGFGQDLTLCFSCLLSLLLLGLPTILFTL